MTEPRLPGGATQLPAGSAALRRISSPVCIGRGGELDLLLRVVTAPPAIAVIQGEAGVGKSRLVAELFRLPELAGLRKLLGTCHALREPFRFEPLVEALRGLGPTPALAALPPLTGALRPLLPELVEILPPAPDPSGDARVDRHLIFRGVRELLACVGSTVCVLEDLHWADDTTIELLRCLVTQLPPEVSLVLTYRGEDAPAPSAIRGLRARLPTHITTAALDLAPLDAAGAGQLAAVILGTAGVPPAFASALHELTGGVPFAVEEVVGLLQDHRPAGPGGEPLLSTLLGLGVPAAIRDLVLERAGRLGPRSRRMVDAAAVLGMPAPEELVTAIAELAPGRMSTAALNAAVESHVLRDVGAGRYGFRHALARQAVYGNIPPPARRRLHRIAAHSLQSIDPVPAALVAHHLREGDRPTEWLRWAEVAADSASSVHNHDAAAHLLREALMTPGIPDQDRPRLTMKLARAALHSATPPAATIPLLRALVDDGAVPPGIRGEVRAALGLLLAAAGEASAGYAEQALAVEELAARPRVAARIMVNLASPWVVEGRVADHLSWLERAVDLAGRGDDPVLALNVRVARALVLLYVGDPAGWAAVDDIPWEIRTGDGGRELLWGAANLVGACIHLGHYARARDFLDDATQRAGELGWHQHMHTPEASALALDWTAGRWEGLEARAREHAEATAFFPGWSAHSELIAGSIALARGDTSVAEQHLRSAMEGARSAGTIPGLVAAGGGLARLLLACGDAAGARREAEAALEVPAAKGIWVWAAEAAPPAVEALIACDRLDDAQRLSARFARGLAGRDAPLALAALHLSQGLVAEARGRGRDAVRAFRRAEQSYHLLPRPYEAARAGTRAGALLLQRGERSGAESMLRALEGFEGLGATADAGRLRLVLRRHGLPVPRHRGAGRRGYGGRLSPREAEVADLAARGRTDAEIAQALFISHRTVSHHVSSALEKLGLRSRRSLIERRQAAPVGDSRSPADTPGLGPPGTNRS